MSRKAPYVSNNESRAERHRVIRDGSPSSAPGGKRRSACYTQCAPQGCASGGTSTCTPRPPPPAPGGRGSVCRQVWFSQLKRGRCWPPLRASPCPETDIRPMWSLHLHPVQSLRLQLWPHVLFLSLSSPLLSLPLPSPCRGPGGSSFSVTSLEPFPDPRPPQSLESPAPVGFSPSTSSRCVTLGKSLTSLCLHVLICRMVMTTGPCPMDLSTITAAKC